MADDADDGYYNGDGEEGGDDVGPACGDRDGDGGGGRVLAVLVGGGEKSSSVHLG